MCDTDSVKRERGDDVRRGVTVRRTFWGHGMIAAAVSCISV